MDNDRIRWVSPSKQADELISLQQARQLVTERASDFTLVKRIGECSPTVGSRGEFVNFVRGEDRIKNKLAERAELARAEAIQAFACDWIGEQLGSGVLKFYRVEKRDQRTPIRGPLVIEESLRDFWQSSERDYRSGSTNCAIPKNLATLLPLLVAR